MNYLEEELDETINTLKISSKKLNSEEIATLISTLTKKYFKTEKKCTRSSRFQREMHRAQPWLLEGNTRPHKKKRPHTFGFWHGSQSMETRKRTRPCAVNKRNNWLSVLGHRSWSIVFGSSGWPWLRALGLKTKVTYSTGRIYLMASRCSSRSAIDRLCALSLCAWINHPLRRDERNGSHANVWSGKKKGTHYLFQGSAEPVLKINRRFAKKWAI